MAESLSKRYLTGLEKFAAFVVSASIMATATFQWQIYQDQISERQEREKILNILERQDGRLTQAELEIAKIRGEMVTWDTLKRIELYLAQMQPQDTNRALVGALSAESEARRSNKK